MFGRFFAHTHDNPSDRYLLSHNASLDRTLGGLLLSHNRCCGWIGHRQILHKVGLFTIQTQCQKLHCSCVRFTEEAFAALVGIIFIKESLSKLFSKLHKTLHKSHRFINPQKWGRRSRCTWILTSTRSRPKSTAVVMPPTTLSWTSSTRCSSEYDQREEPLV